MSGCFPADLGRSLALMLLEVKAELDDWEYYVVEQHSHCSDLASGTESMSVANVQSAELI